MLLNKCKILDCTLRDGGYYTDWNFSSSFFDNYLTTVKSLPISILEIGYISDAKDSLSSFYHLNNKIIKYAKSKVRKDQKIFAMINFKELRNSKHLQKLLVNKIKYLDGIRFAVAPKNIIDFRKLIFPLKNKYQKLSFNLNLMYLSDWIENDNLVEKIFKNLPKNIETLAFVDSFGALEPNQIKKFLEKINNKYSNLYNYGCHFHNNCGLALANSIVAKNNNCSTIDATFSGMGRGAGNAETELILATDITKQKQIKGFHLNNFLEELKKLKNKLNWGSSFAYAFAAKNGYSQSEMMDLIQKRRLDPSTAIEVISNNKKKNKIKFKNLNNLNNLLKFKKLNKKTPILIGGAKSFAHHGGQLLKSISKHSPIFFSGSSSLNNFLDLKLKIKNPKYLILTGNEIKKIKQKKIGNKFYAREFKGIIAEQNFLPIRLKKKLKNIVYSNTVAENPLMLIGKLFLKIRIKKLHIAFFDGNIENEKDKILFNETQNSISALLKQKLDISTITKSAFSLTYVNPWIND